MLFEYRPLGCLEAKPLVEILKSASDFVIKLVGAGLLTVETPERP